MSEHIRQATEKDVSRLAEILVFNNRLNFYPIFRCDEYSFGEMQVIPIANEFLNTPGLLARTFVYDDGVVRGMMVLEGDEVKRLFVEPSFQGRGIGAALMERILSDARAIGYERVVLDTLPFLKSAIALYRARGFEDIPPYNVSPIANPIYLGLELRSNDPEPV